MKIFLTFFLLLTIFLSTADAQTEKTSTQTKNPAKNTTVKEQKSDESSKENQTNLQQSAYTRPDAKKRFKRYVNGTVGPLALAKTFASAGYSTWRNSPEEWGDRWEGFGRRVASGFGKNVIKQTAIYGLDEALELDSGFYRSQNRSFKAKFKNAVVSPFTARKSDGKRTLGVPRIVGTYTSSVVAAEVWSPSRFDYKDGLRSGTISLGFNVLTNLFKEFVWKK